MASLQPPIFSMRERNYLVLFVEGLSPKEIAKKMAISTSTVAVMKLNVRGSIGKGVDTDVRLYKWAVDNKEELKG